MKTLSITQDHAANLTEILLIFNDSRMLKIQEGTLTRHNVTLEWDKDIILLTFKDPPAMDHSKEE